MIIYQNNFKQNNIEEIESFLSDMRDLLVIKEDKIEFLRQRLQTLEQGYGIDALSKLSVNPEQFVRVTIGHTSDTGEHDNQIKIRIRLTDEKL